MLNADEGFGIFLHHSRLTASNHFTQSSPLYDRLHLPWSFPGVEEPGMLDNDPAVNRETLYPLPPPVGVWPTSPDKDRKPNGVQGAGLLYSTGEAGSP